MKFSVLAAAVVGIGLAFPALARTTVTFDNGPEGWSIQNAVTIDPTNGNPGACLSHFQIDTFGINVANTTSPEFLGDYGNKGPLNISIDFQVDRIWTEFFGDVSRDIVVEFRNYDLAPGGYPWVSVWKNLGTLHTGMDWTTFDVDIVDPNSTILPAGWGGYGAEDPNTFEPILPDGVTYADVLSGVDEIVFTTFVPGWFFGFTNFDFKVDNISISAAVPGPSGLAMLMVAGLASRRRRRD